MSVDYSKFDKAVDLEGLKKDAEEAEKNGGGNYKEVPYGDYEVKVEKMELTESKKGDPMVSIWFKVLAGEYEGSYIFYNQVVTQGFQIHLVNQLLRTMTGDESIQFDSYSQYGDLLLNTHEAIDGKLEFALRYGETKKGFPTYEITEVYEVE